MKFGKHIIITEMSKHPTCENKYLTAQGTYKAVQDSHDNMRLKKEKEKKEEKYKKFILTGSYSSMSILVKNIFTISTSMKNPDDWEQKSNQKKIKKIRQIHLCIQITGEFLLLFFALNCL